MYFYFKISLSFYTEMITFVILFFEYYILLFCILEEKQKYFNNSMRYQTIVLNYLWMSFMHHEKNAVIDTYYRMKINTKSEHYKSQGVRLSL